MARKSVAEFEVYQAELVQALKIAGQLSKGAELPVVGVVGVVESDRFPRLFVHVSAPGVAAAFEVTAAAGRVDEDAVATEENLGRWESAAYEAKDGVKYGSVKSVSFGMDPKACAQAARILAVPRGKQDVAPLVRVVIYGDAVSFFDAGALELELPRLTEATVPHTPYPNTPALALFTGVMVKMAPSGFKEKEIVSVSPEQLEALAKVAKGVAVDESLMLVAGTMDTGDQLTFAWRESRVAAVVCRPAEEAVDLDDVDFDDPDDLLGEAESDSDDELQFLRDALEKPVAVASAVVASPPKGLA